jgi:hypothetical protein
MRKRKRRVYKKDKKRTFTQDREEFKRHRNTRYHPSMGNFVHASSNFPGFMDPEELNKKDLYTYR